MITRVVGGAYYQKRSNLALQWTHLGKYQRGWPYSPELGMGGLSAYHKHHGGGLLHCFRLGAMWSQFSKAKPIH